MTITILFTVGKRLWLMRTKLPNKCNLTWTDILFNLRNKKRFGCFVHHCNFNSIYFLSFSLWNWSHWQAWLLVAQCLFNIILQKRVLVHLHSKLVTCFCGALQPVICVSIATWATCSQHAWHLWWFFFAFFYSKILYD